MIRVATPADAEELLAIYAPYVEKTAVSFEYTVPGVQAFRERMLRVLERYPYLAAERGGEIAGYAYAGPFHARAAYEWGVETTVYVREDQRKNGIGRALYEALERALALQNILNLNACIAVPETEDEYLTRNSLQFHQAMGYRFVGEFSRCGYKFNRWYNIAWMEKHIGVHTECPKTVRRFDEIREALAAQYGIK